MNQSAHPGKIVLLIGAPRSGKTSILNAMRDSYEPPWVDAGLDTYWEHIWGFDFIQRGKFGGAIVYDNRPHPNEMPEPYRHRGRYYEAFNSAMFENMATHAKYGVNVVADIVPLFDDFLPEFLPLVELLPVYLVGVRCPVEEIMHRRIQVQEPGREHIYITLSQGDPIPPVVHMWQRLAHSPGVYDLEVNTSLLSPEECAEQIQAWLETGPQPTAMRQILSG